MHINVRDATQRSSSRVGRKSVTLAGRSELWVAIWAAKMISQIHVGPRSASCMILPMRLWVRSFQARKARNSNRRTSHPTAKIAAKMARGRINSIGLSSSILRMAFMPFLTSTDSHNKSLHVQAFRRVNGMCGDVSFGGNPLQALEISGHPEDLEADPLRAAGGTCGSGGPDCGGAIQTGPAGRKTRPHGGSLHRLF